MHSSSPHSATASWKRGTCAALSVAALAAREPTVSHEAWRKAALICAIVSSLLYAAMIWESDMRVTASSRRSPASWRETRTGRDWCRGTERYANTVAAGLFMRVMEPAALIMTRRMLLGLKQRAEALRAARPGESRANRRAA